MAKRLVVSAGRQATRELRVRVAMEWVIARCPDGRPLHQYISGGGYLDVKYLGADMKGVVLTARAYGVEARAIYHQFRESRRCQRLPPRCELLR
jgi:hypothetical protein